MRLISLKTCKVPAIVICTIHFHAILFQAEADTFYN